MKLSIRSTLVFCLLFIIWGTQAITLPSAYITSQRVITHHARDIMDNIAEFAIARSQHYLSLAQGATHLTKRLLASDVVSDDHQRMAALERYFIDQLTIYSHFAGIYFGTPNGDFFYVNRDNTHSPHGFRTKIIRTVNGIRSVSLTFRDRHLKVLETVADPTDTYDPRVRPWYIKAQREKRIVWTDPYVFFTSQKPGITIAGPVYRKNGELKGVVGVDIEIDQLSTFIGKLRIGKHGRAFMLNRNMDVVAFPEPEKLVRGNTALPGHTRLVKIQEIDDPLSRLAFKAVPWKMDANGRILLSKPVFAKFQHAGETYSVAFTPFPDRQWPWIIGIYLPENDYLGGIKHNRTFNIGVTLAMSLVASLIGWLMGRSILRPLSQLEEEAHTVKSHDFRPTQRIRSVYTEIQETADSFGSMKASLLAQEKEKAVLEERIRHTEKMTAIGTLAGGIAHDFNNILFPIIGNAEMALEVVDGNEESREHLTEILTAAKRAQKLVEQILTFGHRDPPNRVPTAIQSVLQETLSLLRAAMPANIVIEEDIDMDCGAVLAEPIQIQQLILNLCANARHAMQEAGGTLRVELHAIRIAGESTANELPHEEPVAFAKIIIQDTGVGMTPELQTRIFEPYFTTRKKGEGSGLGLAIAHGIVSSYGGEIQVHSALGEGSRFDIYLPITDMTTVESEPPEPVGQAGTERILVIDDEDQIVRMVGLRLSRLGYRVDCHTDAQAALAAFQATPEDYDLVITDMTMPTTTGDRLAKEMLKTRPDTPIIMLTGFSELIDEKRARAIGIRRLLYKPVDTSDLAKTIRGILDARTSPPDDVPAADNAT